MKKVQVLGPGCPKCVELAKRTAEAAEALGGDFEVEKVSDRLRSRSKSQRGRNEGGAR